MAPKNVILIRNERESVIELSGVTDVNGYPVSLEPKGMERDSRQCYDSVVTHQHVQTFLDQTPPWISVMKLNSDGTVPEAPTEAPTFDISDTVSESHTNDPLHSESNPEQIVAKIRGEIECILKRVTCASVTTGLTVREDSSELAIRRTLELHFEWPKEYGITPEVFPVTTEEASSEPITEEPVAAESTPELLPVDDDALGPLPDLEEPTETSTPKRRKSRNS